MSKRSDKFQNLINRQREREQESSPPSGEIIPGDEHALSPSETDELNRCERIIDKGLRTFFEVGTALLRVRNLRLYRVEYSSFETYCSERWSIERRRAYQLMDAAKVTESVNNCTQIAPANEAQARPLTRLSDPEQQRQAWEQVVQLAAGARITARLVEQVVEELLAQVALHSPNGAEIIDMEPAAASSPDDFQALPEGEMPVAESEQEFAGILDDSEEDSADRIPEQATTAVLQPPSEGWPDDLYAIDQVLHSQGFELDQATETRWHYRRDNEQFVVVQPPSPGQVRVRIVAHRADDWADVAERLALVGVTLDSPRAGHLPKYPETQRAYGTLDLNMEQLDDVASLRAELAQTRAAQRRVMDILHEYQEYVTRAQNYKPTSERGEAVSPFLRLVERLWLELQETTRTKQ